ncbi:hypothetical protein [Methylovirgula sp. 4M-Z18]|uniref:hypothetical protein n=1 Tax=Methylovirgula sp. 4M-Z18 TaxID=2293567 RepID=UPI0011C07F8B|nr:hypothetical protein [Methylovirgula sp. 4M-Z18]
MHIQLTLAIIMSMYSGSILAATANPCGQCPPDKKYCVVGCGGAHCEANALELQAPQAGACEQYEAYIGATHFSINRLSTIDTK